MNTKILLSCLLLCGLPLGLAGCKDGKSSSASGVETGSTFENLPSLTNVEGISFARLRHTATKLQDGRVLVVGGVSNAADDFAEIFDPTNNTWTLGPKPVLANRFNAKSVLLNDGRVLVVGGVVKANGHEFPAKEIEAYDPLSNSFSVVATLASTRNGSSVTLLKDGRVLVLGGSYFDSGAAQWVSQNDGEIFDPTTNQLSSVSLMATARTGHTATLLSSGQVIITGGLNSAGITTTVIEYFQPWSNSFVQSNSSLQGRYNHFSFLDENENVVSIGGRTQSSNGVNPPFTFNSETFLKTGYATFSPIYNAAFSTDTACALQLADGNIILTSPETTSIYGLNTSTSSFLPIATMEKLRIGYTTTELNDGSLLIVGGSDSEDYTPIFDVERISITP